ncbi:hypothetical protein CHS0354_018232 [Potamilus streckersoni]|uniref:Uncharacterized protein n=1 Tax=Potamilus streckersoni TaxID=2493646 RepID=A0AAE0SJI2_9BIVA|nr:hypothetical protein CHS0354_018232 [Potamilus streckersoni]
MFSGLEYLFYQISTVRYCALHSTVGGVHESEDISGIKVAMDDVKFDMIGLLRHLRRLTLDLHLRLFDLCTELEYLLIETKMLEWILCKGGSFSDTYPLIDVTLTGGRSTIEVKRCGHGSGCTQCIQPSLDVLDLMQSRTKHLKRRGSDMLDMNESILPHPGKVMKPGVKQQYLEGTRDSNQPGSQQSTCSVANNRKGGTEAPPLRQGIEIWDIIGIVHQEPDYNASRGRRTTLDIKQENEDLKKMLNCIVLLLHIICISLKSCFNIFSWKGD